MTEYASRGDARRSMFLLWGKLELGSRGPKQGPASSAAGR